MVKKLDQQEREKTAERLLRAAAARYGAVREKAARAHDRDLAERRTRIIITIAARGMPYLVPGEIYDTYRGFRG